jgi:hypothetical protein
MMDEYEIKEHQKPILYVLKDGEPFTFARSKRNKNIQVLSLSKKQKDKLNDGMD